MPLSGFFDFRDKTMLEQAALLDPAPEIALLWIGNNDVLGSLLAGGEESPTDGTVFAAEFEAVLKRVKKITNKVVVANIPSYIPLAYALDRAKNGNVFMVFDPQTFEPIDFDPAVGGELYVPLLFDPEESDAEHIILMGGLAYMDEGYGIPAYDDLISAGVQADDATGLIDGKDHFGEPLDEKYLLTGAEETALQDAVAGFNTSIAALAAAYNCPLVDANDLLSLDGLTGAGYSGEFVYFAPETTAFSLDGVHVSNLGHALCANAFIQAINGAWAKGIPPLDPGNYAGQYANIQVRPRALEAIRRVSGLYGP